VFAVPTGTPSDQVLTKVVGKKRWEVIASPIAINIQTLTQEIEYHPDRDLCTRIISGLSEGFKTGIVINPQISHECKNLLSTKEFSKDVTALLHEELDKGFIVGPYEYPPFHTVRINPLGIVHSKYSCKKRLIVDMSSPHNSEVASINNLINKDEFSLSYVRVDDAIRIIKTLRHDKPIYLCKTDIADAFKQLPLHPSVWPFHGVKWQEQYYFFTRLVFGCRSSPKLFDTFASLVCWILENNYGITPLLHLLDDFLAICPEHVAPDQFMATMLSVFTHLGLPLSSKKTVGPCTSLEFLGIFLCTDQMVARLPENKLIRIRSIVSTFLSLRKCRKRQLLSLLGHLQFACRVITPGRAFTARLLKAACSAKELYHYVTLTREAKLDLKMWHQLLAEWNGVSMFLDLATTNSYDLELYTDASGVGFGGYFHGAWFYGPWPPNLQEVLDSVFSIAFKELYPIVVAAVLFGRDWGQKRLLFHCDNMATVCVLNKGRSDSPAIMQLMRRLALIAAKSNFAYASEHVPGVENQLADSLSRFQLHRFRQLAPQADPLPTPVPTDVLFS
jgi:hypothetical protein